MAVAFSIAWLCSLFVCLCIAANDYEGKVIKGNRNALFLVQGGKRSAFPDFYTFTQMGFNMSVIQKIPDDILNRIPMGTPIKSIEVYRGEDYMYHRLCSDPDRLVICSVFKCYVHTTINNSFYISLFAIGPRTRCYSKYGQPIALSLSTSSNKDQQKGRDTGTGRKYHSRRILKRIRQIIRAERRVLCDNTQSWARGNRNTM